MSASTESLGSPWRGFFSLWLPAALGAVLVVPYIALALYCTGHDSYDDSGYVLAILRGIAGGGHLYEDVFSQYGPFHAGAWLLFFRSLGLPLDHNHAALGVGLLWLVSAGGVAWCVRRVTGSAWWALAAALWGAWSLYRLTAELAHPKSLVVALATLALAAGCFHNRKARVAVTGAAVAALTLTKINLGVFALVALALAWWHGAAPRRWLALGAGAVSGLLPLLLLRHAWPETPRLMLGASVCLATLMILQCAPRQANTTGAIERETLREAAAFLGVFLLSVALIVLGARIGGTGFRALIDGVLIRPMGLRDSFSLVPAVVPWEGALLLFSAALALLWQIPALRARRELWQAALVLVVAAEFYWDASSGLPFCFTSASLLWIAVAAQPVREASHETTGRWLVFASLLAAWQTLGVFPVSGAQGTLPRFLVHGVWIAALGGAFTQPATGGRARSGAALPFTARLVVIAGLTCLASGSMGRIRVLLAGNTRVSLPGTDWFRWPADQNAALDTLVANLRQCEGPLFTFPGQHSLPIWAGKPPLNGFNCTHSSALLRRAELDDTLARFRAAPRWCALVSAGGESFGRGPYFGMIQAFLQQNTRPWLRLGDWELRLAGQLPPASPLHAVWKSAGRWSLHAPDPAARTATKARLYSGGYSVKSFRWKPVPPSRPVDAPDELRAALDALTAGSAYLSLCNEKREPLALLPVVSVATREEEE